MHCWLYTVVLLAAKVLSHPGRLELEWVQLRQLDSFCVLGDLWC